MQTVRVNNLRRLALPNSIPFRAWYSNQRRRKRRAAAAGGIPAGAMTTSPALGSYRFKTLVMEFYNATTGLYTPHFAKGTGNPGDGIRTAWGAGNAAAADANVPMTASPALGSYRVKTIGSDQIWEVYNVDSAAYHAFYCYGSGNPGDGLRTAWAAADLTAASADAILLQNPTSGSWRVKNGVTWQSYNPITGLFHTYFPTGLAGAIQDNWGAGEA